MPAQIPERASAVIIGGGVLGLETAGALKSRNKDLKITVIEGFDYVMPRQLNEKAANYLQNHLEQLGINIITNTSVKQINGNVDGASLVGIGFELVNKRVRSTAITVGSLLE